MLIYLCIFFSILHEGCLISEKIADIYLRAIMVSSWNHFVANGTISSFDGCIVFHAKDIP